MVHVLRKGGAPATASPAAQAAAPTPRKPAKPKPQPAASHAESKPMDALDRLVAAGPLDVLGLMLWQGRHRNPEMMVKLTEADMEGLRACTDYLKIKPQVRIQRPPGAPAMPEVPATATRSARPAVPAEGPRPYVLVQLLDQHGNAFAPVENNEQDDDRRIAAAKLRAAIDQAPGLAARIASAARSNDFVASDVVEASEVMMTLLRSVR